jgi:hypothetical protein
MSSRNAYAALTPDFVDFPLAHPPSGGPQSLSIPETFDHEGDLSSKVQSRWCIAISAMRVVVDNNTGLLLVAASQAFFSLMNLSVKMLNSLDPPVSALEVRSFRQPTIARPSLMKSSVIRSSSLGW